MENFLIRPYRYMAYENLIFDVLVAFFEMLEFVNPSSLLTLFLHLDLDVKN